MWFYIFATLLAVVFYLVKTSKFDYWEKLGVPTASGCNFFFGHYRPIFFVEKHIVQLYDTFYNEFPNAALVGFYIMGPPVLLVKDLSIIKSILLTEFASFNFTGFHVNKKEDFLAASNPFILIGDEWKTARSHVTPALSLAKLKGYLPIMLDVGDEMAKYVKNIAAEGPIELNARELAEMFTTDVIGNAIYGIKNNTFQDNNSLFAQLTREILFEYNIRDNFKMFLQLIPGLRRFFPARFSPKKLQDIMISLTRKIITERASTGKKRNDVYEMLLTLKENDSKGVGLMEDLKTISFSFIVVTAEYMSGLVFTIITDMYETSSGMISLILCTLSRHLDIQENLRDEIMQIKLKNNGKITIQDVESAKYLDKVFCESFRMYSFMLSRECTQDCYLPVPGSEPLKVTKGTSLVIPVASIHKDPKYFPDPEKFDPERFSDDEVARRLKYAYMPFGEGPRKCLGSRIASLEIKIMLMKLLESFMVNPSDKTKYPIEMDPKGLIPLRPKNGAWVYVEEIK